MLGTNTRRGPTVRNTASEGWRTVQVSYFWIVVLMLFAFGLSPLVMALCNYIGWQPLTGIWTVIVTFIILIWGLRPTNLGWVSIIYGVYSLLMDRDGSQGVAAGPKLLWNLVISIAFAHFMMGLTATAWDFNSVSGGFLAAWMVGLGFVLWNLKFNTEAYWYQRLTLMVLLSCTVGIIWQSFDISLKNDAFHQDAFDPYTGEPTKMGYFNLEGDWVNDPQERSPVDCRMKGADGNPLAHFYADGSIYPYEAHSTCFSPVTGERLVPIPADQVPDASRATLPGLLDGLFSTQAEKDAAARAETKRQEEARRLEVELEKLRAKAAADARRTVTPEPVRIAPVLTVSERRGCDGAYQNTLNCVTVNIPAGLKHIHSVDPIVDDSRRRCVQSYPSGFNRVQVQPGVFEFTNVSGRSMTYKVYEVFEGESGPGRNRCG